MRLYRVVALAFFVILQGSVWAQTWPTRVIKLIVPFPAGGTGDMLGRLAAKEMEASLGQPVMVENRAGAGGLIGSDAAAKAPADGYTLVLSNIASHAIAPAVYAKMPYDAVHDFSHIGLVAGVPSGIVVAANSSYPSLTALLTKERNAPGAVRFGSNGNGTSSHVKLAILNKVAKVDITHIPYKGSAPATADLLGGQIDGLIAAVPDVGRNPLLRMLAVTSDKRVARWPDVPSVSELGLAPLVASNWFGISGPAGIPKPIADRLNAALVAALNSPEVANRLRDLGAEPNRMTRSEYTSMIATEVSRWSGVAKYANIQID
jgi:hypothetical protein